MARISRRKLIELLGASVLAGGLRSDGSLANAVISLSSDDVRKFDPKRFVGGCIFIRRQPETIDLSSIVSIDLWKSRVSDTQIDPPNKIGEVIVWDDLFFKENLLPDIRKTIHHISKWFHTPFGRCTYGLHVSGYNTLAEAILRALPSERERQNVRIAIIDASSCGPTRLEWTDILPTIREAYDLVIGVSYSPGDTMGDFSRLSEVPIEEDKTLKEIIAYCDVVLLQSDGLIGLHCCTTCDERYGPFNKLFDGLVGSLASPNIFLELCNGARPAVFCIGPAQSTDQPMTSVIDRQASVVSTGFSDGVIDHRYDGASPIVLDQIILWPLVYDAPDEDQTADKRHTTNSDVVPS